MTCILTSSRRLLFAGCMIAMHVRPMEAYNSTTSATRPVNTASDSSRSRHSQSSTAAVCYTQRCNSTEFLHSTNRSFKLLKTAARNLRMSIKIVNNLLEVREILRTVLCIKVQDTTVFWRKLGKLYFYFFCDNFCSTPSPSIAHCHMFKYPFRKLCHSSTPPATSCNT